MFKTTHRFLTALVAFFALAFATSAQNVKLSLGNLVLNPGKETTVSLDLENDVPVGAVVTADIFLPEGVTVEFINTNNSYVQRSSRVSEFAQVAASTQNENPSLASTQLRVIILDLDNKIEAGKGPLLTFQVKTDKDAQVPLNAVAHIKDANVDGVKIDEVECPVVDGSFEGAISANAIEVTPTKEATVTLNMSNNLAVAMMQTRIALPEGLSFVENEEGKVFTPSNRIASTHYVEATFDGNTALVMVKHKDWNSPLDIIGNAGPLFSFNVKADATLAAEDVINFTQVIGTSLKGRTFNFEPVAISVSNPDVAAVAAADAAVKALEEKLTATVAALAEYAEEVQTAVAEKKAAAEQKVADVKAAAQASKDNGTAAADLETLNAAVAEAEALCDALAAEAKAAQEKYVADKAAEAAAVEAIDAAVKALEEKLAATVATLAEYAEEVQTAVVDKKAAAEQKVADVKAAAQTSKDNGTAAADLETLNAAVAEAEALCDALAAEAKAAQEKYEADKAAEEAKKAEADQYAANLATIDALEAALKQAKADAKLVGNDCTEEVDAIEKLIERFVNKVEIVHSNSASVASVEEIDAAANHITEKIEAINATNNALQNNNDKEAFADVEAAMAAANETLATYHESVQAAMAETKAAAEQAVAAAAAAIASSFEAGTSIADAEANAALMAAANEAIQKLVDDAKAAQDAWLASRHVISIEFTSVEELAGQTFAIINKENGKVLYGSNNQNLGYANAVEAFKTTNTGYYFRLETPAEDAEDATIASLHLLRLVTPAGEGYTIWGSNGYLNSQPVNGNCSFILGLNNQNGQDIKNGAVWDIQYVEGKGFTLLNKGTGFYLTGNGTCNSEEPAYWNFCQVYTDVIEQNAPQYTEDLAAVAAAQAAYDEAAKEIATYPARVQAAVAESLNAAQSKIDAAAAAVNASFFAATSVADAEANAALVAEANAAVEQMKADAQTALENYVPYIELAAGDYLIKNVATGMYLGGANSWGTQASLVEHGRIFTVAALEDGTYTLDSHTYNNAEQHFLGLGGYIDQNATGLSLYAVEGGVAIGGADTKACFAAPAEGTVLVNNAAYNDEAALWQFISVADAVAELEAAAEGCATFLIKDAAISRNAYNQATDAAWEGTPMAKGGPVENMNAEKWGGNSQEFDTYQVVNLPNGTYELSVQGYYRYNNTTDNTNDVAIAAHADGTEVINSFFYANDVEMPFKSIADDEAAAALEAEGKGLPFSQGDAAAAFAMGLYVNTLTVEVTDGTLKIGVKKTSHPGCDWTVWDNFTLTKVVPDAINDVVAGKTIVSRKALENGKVVIYRNGKKYSVTGTVLK